MQEYNVLKPFSRGLFTNLFEVWKDIEHFEGYYKVSSFGNVKSLSRMRRSKGGSLAPLRERILKHKTSKCGYKVLHLRNDRSECHPSVHRLVASAFLTNEENKPTVNHIDGDKSNNKVSNLEWATCSEQMKHAVSLDLLQVRGSPKFSKKEKQHIYDYYHNNDISILKLSEMFNMSERTVGRIIKGVIPRTTTRVKKSGEVIIENILTKEQVEEIKLLREDGWTLSRLAEKFNRGTSQMHRVVKNKTRTSHIE